MSLSRTDLPRICDGIRALIRSLEKAGSLLPVWERDPVPVNPFYGVVQPAVNELLKLIMPSGVHDNADDCHDITSSALDLRQQAALLDLRCRLISMLRNSSVVTLRAKAIIEMEDWCRKLDMTTNSTDRALETRDMREVRFISKPSPTLEFVLPNMLSAADLARALQRSPSQVESKLRRLRRTHKDCYTETSNPRKNEPRYLYRVSDVLPHLGVE